MAGSFNRVGNKYLHQDEFLILPGVPKAFAGTAAK